MKVLVVDDNEAAADLLAELLADEHAVRVVYSSAQACNAVLEETFDVALVDIKPRNAPGNMLAGQLRDALPALVLVAVTASIAPTPARLGCESPFKNQERASAPRTSTKNEQGHTKNEQGHTSALVDRLQGMRTKNEQGHTSASSVVVGNVASTTLNRSQRPQLDLDPA